MIGRDIKAEMIRRGIKQQDIADEAKCTRQTVNYTIYDKMNCRRVVETIARRLNLEPEQVKDWYVRDDKNSSLVA